MGEGQVMSQSMLGLHCSDWNREDGRSVFLEYMASIPQDRALRLRRKLKAEPLRVGRLIEALMEVAIYCAAMETLDNEAFADVCIRFHESAREDREEQRQARVDLLEASAAGKVQLHIGFIERAVRVKRCLEELSYLLAMPLSNSDRFVPDPRGIGD
jgi:hypothetical protein